MTKDATLVTLPVASIVATWAHLILMNLGRLLVGHIVRVHSLSMDRDLLFSEMHMVALGRMFTIHTEMIIVGAMKTKGISEVPMAQGMTQLNMNMVNGRDAITRAQSTITDVHGIIAGISDQNIQKCPATMNRAMTFQA